MENSNQLLDGLYYVRNLLEAMQKQNAEQQQLESKLRETVQPKQRIQAATYRGKKAVIIIFLILSAFFLLSNLSSIYSQDQQKIESEIANDEYSWIMNHYETGEPYPGYDGPTKANFSFSLLKAALYTFPVTAVIALIVGGILSMKHKAKNRQIEKRNQEIESWNQKVAMQNQEIKKRNNELKDEIQKICNKKVMISEEYQKNVLSWFPKDYGYFSAVNYFINKVENHLANSVAEAVQQYEEDRFRQQQLDKLSDIRQGQEDMVRQQMIGNLIGLANFMQLGQISSAVDQSNIHLGRIADAENQIANKINSF